MDSKQFIIFKIVFILIVFNIVVNGDVGGCAGNYPIDCFNVPDCSGSECDNRDGINNNSNSYGSTHFNNLQSRTNSRQ